MSFLVYPREVCKASSKVDIKEREKRGVKKRKMQIMKMQYHGKKIPRTPQREIKETKGFIFCPLQIIGMNRLGDDPFGGAGASPVHCPATVDIAAIVSAAKTAKTFSCGNKSMIPSDSGIDNESIGLLLVDPMGSWTGSGEKDCSIEYGWKSSNVGRKSMWHASGGSGEYPFPGG